MPEHKVEASSMDTGDDTRAELTALKKTLEQHLENVALLKKRDYGSLNALEQATLLNADAKEASLRTQIAPLEQRVTNLTARKRKRVSGDSDAPSPPRSRQKLSHPDGSLPTSPAAADSKAEAKFVRVSGLKLAGLRAAQSDDEFLLFASTQTTRLWRALGGSRNLRVDGPPGTGKTLATFAWCRQQWASGQTLLWIHLGQEEVSHTVLKLIGGSEQTELWRPSSLASLQAAIDDEKYGDADILVVDGASREQTLKLTAWTTARSAVSAGAGAGASSSAASLPRRRFIIVSSQAKGSKLHIEQDEADLERHLVFGWTLADYELACKNEDFLKQVDKHLDSVPANEPLAARLAAKFFYAGGSCRFMFHVSTAAVMQTVQDAISGLSDQSAFASGAAGFRSKAGSNTLLTLVSESSSRPVSQFVRSELVWCLDDAMMRAMQLAASDDGAFDGKVLEFQFTRRLRAASSGSGAAATIDLFDEGLLGGKAAAVEAKASPWPVARVVTFATEADLPGLLKDSVSLDGVWLKPRSYNQGAFDAVHLREAAAGGSLLVSFVQVTRAASHDCKMWYLELLLRQLRSVREVVGVDMIVVRDKDGSKFEHLKVEGRSAICESLKDKGFCKAEQTRVLAFRRS